MLCIAKIASCRTFSPAAFQLRKLVAGGEIPDSACACISVVHFSGASRGEWYALHTIRAVFTAQPALSSRFPADSRCGREGM